jgi:hypothetical protein
MSDRDLFDAVARKTGEDSHELARRGFVLSSLDRPPAQAPRRTGRTWPASSGHRLRADGKEI